MICLRELKATPVTVGGQVYMLQKKKKKRVIEIRIKKEKLLPVFCSSWFTNVFIFA